MASHSPPSQGYWCETDHPLAQGSWPTLMEMLSSASTKVVMANVNGGEWGRGGRSKSHPGTEPDPQPQTWRVYKEDAHFQPNSPGAQEAVA